MITPEKLTKEELVEYVYALKSMIHNLQQYPRPLNKFIEGEIMEKLADAASGRLTESELQWTLGEAVAFAKVQGEIEDLKEIH